jgi:hypothetical protein
MHNVQYYTVGTLLKSRKTQKYHTVGTVPKSRKTQKYHTVGTILKSNKTIVEMNTPNTQIQDLLHSWLRTITSINSGGVKLVYWPKRHLFVN